VLTKDKVTAAPDRRRRLNAKAYREIIQRQKASGVSLYRYCKDRALPYTTIANWRRREKNVPPQPSVNFVPVQITPASQPNANAVTKSERPETIEICLGHQHQRIVRVSGNFDMATLQRVITTIESVPC
jgi:hypothetical protein